MLVGAVHAPTSLFDGSAEALMQTKSFGGAGFRAKEVLCDLVEVVDLWLDLSKRQIVGDQFLETTVIGVGPCRAANWLLNLPFRLNDAAWLSYAFKAHCFVFWLRMRLLQSC